MPSIVEGTESLKLEQMSKRREAHQKLLQRATHDVFNRLLAWDVSHGVPIYSVDEDGDIPDVITYAMIAANHLMSLYWSVCVRLGLMHRAALQVGEQLDTPFDIDELCVQILRAVRLFLHPSAGLFRQHIMPFPLSSAMQHLHSVGQERLVWERKKLWEVLNHRECSVVREFLLSMEPQAKGAREANLNDLASEQK